MDVLKPYYQKNGITIYCGECSKVLGQFPDLHFNLTVTSPPYDALREYQGYTFDFGAISSQLWRVTDKGGVVVWVVADQTVDGSETGTSFRQALGFMELGFKLHDTMIYEVAGTGAKGSNLAYWQGFEYMFVLCKGKIKTVNRINDKINTSAGATCSTGRIASNGAKKDTKKRRVNSTGIRSNIWRYNVNRYAGDSDNHPAPFPEALARDHILSWSNPGDLVLDPMAGSGTTGKMALELGRRCVMIDISEEYCKIMVERLRQPSFWSLPTQDGPRNEQLELTLDKLEQD